MRKESETMQKIGSWAFIIGIILAILAGIIGGWQGKMWVVVILAILGIVVGLLNITGKESTPFLVATIALMLASTGLNIVFTAFSLVWFVHILNNVIVFIAPAAAVVALKAIFALAKSE
jgi:hypothetical protein